LCQRCSYVSDFEVICFEASTLFVFAFGNVNLDIVSKLSQDWFQIFESCSAVTACRDSTAQHSTAQHSTACQKMFNFYVQSFSF
jgi:hypothetical protein